MIERWVRHAQSSERPDTDVTRKVTSSPFETFGLDRVQTLGLMPGLLLMQAGL